MNCWVFFLFFSSSFCYQFENAYLFVPIAGDDKAPHVHVTQLRISYLFEQAACLSRYRPTLQNVLRRLIQ